MYQPNPEVLATVNALTAERRVIRAGEILSLKEDRKKADVAELPITAKLHNWKTFPVGERGDYVIYGIIEGDTRKRFADGVQVRTSMIAKVVGDIAVTLNSNYQLIGEEVGK